MKLMKTEDAVGQVLCHDITQIIRGVTKDAVFRKGHVITEEDIPVLLSVGKEHVYIWEKDENMLHENEAADILRQICQSDGMHATEPKEGKIELIADTDGLLMVNLGRQFLYTKPWLSLAPSIAIMLVVLAFNFLGDGLRDVLDPHLKDQ